MNRGLVLGFPDFPGFSRMPGESHDFLLLLIIPGSLGSRPQDSFLQSEGCLESTCHAETGADLPPEKRIQPPPLLLLRTKHVQHLHVSCVCGGKSGAYFQFSRLLLDKQRSVLNGDFDMIHPRTVICPRSRASRRAESRTLNTEQRI